MDAKVIPVIFVDARTMKALDGSVEKWMRVERGGKEHGPTDCPLCQLFHSSHDKDGISDNCCKGCPIAEDTGQKYCAGTPYEDFDVATMATDGVLEGPDLEDWLDRIGMSVEQAREHYAGQMLAYLRRLRDKCRVEDQTESEGGHAD